jgi:hypothetical protein
VLIYVQKTYQIVFQVPEYCSPFRSEFSTSTDQIEALLYKLQMIVAPIDGLVILISSIAGFKKSALTELVCNKQQNSIAYHHTHDGQAALSLPSGLMIQPGLRTGHSLDIEDRFNIAITAWGDTMLILTCYLFTARFVAPSDFLMVRACSLLEYYH